MFRAVALAAAVLALAACAPSDADASVASAVPTASADPASDVVGPIAAAVVATPPPVLDASVEAHQEAQGTPPQRVVIDSVGVGIGVTPVGLAADGTMELPDTSLEAGWYRFGAAPTAERGNIVIAAHVDNARDGLGPFFRLKDMKAGDVVRVDTAEGETVEYVVTAVQQTNKESVNPDDLFARGDGERLVLVTCGGRWNSSERSYEDNVIVYAEPVGLGS